VEVNKLNQWLANAQYWLKKPLLIIFWPQEIRGLEPIMISYKPTLWPPKPEVPAASPG